MWLIGACAGVVVVIILLVAVLYAQSKDETQRQKDPLYHVHLQHAQPRRPRPV